MARVTTESCLKSGEIENRFELVLIASFRARCIESGSALGLDDEQNGDKDAILPVNYTSGEKSVVLALREIERASVNVELIRELLSKKRSSLESSAQEGEPAGNQADEFPGEVAIPTEVTSEDEAFYIAGNFEEEDVVGPGDEELEFE